MFINGTVIEFSGILLFYIMFQNLPVGGGFLKPVLLVQTFHLTMVSSIPMKDLWKIILCQQDPYISKYVFISVTRLSHIYSEGC